MSQANLHDQQLAEREKQSPTRTRISQLGWAIITLLFVLGAINFADKAVLGLGVVTFGNAIGPAVFAPLLTLLIVMVGWRAGAHRAHSYFPELATRG